MAIDPFYSYSFNLSKKNNIAIAIEKKHSSGKKAVAKARQQAMDAFVAECIERLNAPESANFVYKSLWQLGFDKTREILNKALGKEVRNPKAYFIGACHREMLVRK